jgi:hypothetical protein
MNNMRKIFKLLLVLFLLISPIFDVLIVRSEDIVSEDDFLQQETDSQTQIEESENTENELLEEVIDQSENSSTLETEENLENDEFDNLTSEQVEQNEQGGQMIENFEVKKARLIIKKEDIEIFNQELEILETESIVLDNTNTERIINDNSVLGLLNQADIQSDNFQISDLAYYSSFDSYLINCIEVIFDSENTENLCYNWQYVVDDVYPWVGASDYVLNGEETIYFYFGQPKRITWNTDQIFSNTEFNLLAEKYNYADNSWSSLASQNIGIILNDFAWPVNEIATSMTNSEGFAKFTITEPGEYRTGFVDDWYYPSHEIVVLVEQIIENPETDDVSNNNLGGSGGSGIIQNPNTDNSPVKSEINKKNLIDFLYANQKQNGSFGASLYTDWVAIGLGSAKASNQSLLDFILNDDVGNDLFDVIRRSMALLANNLNPYSDYKENLIEIILDNFDGNQFGDPNLFNDDIFAILVLQNAGFNYSDIEIKNSINFILSKQKSNGSFDGVDLTAATIQALSEFSSQSEINNAISKAKNFLKNNQKQDGGWDNVFATSWVIMSINSLGEDVDAWKKDNTPIEFLALNQDVDGGLLKDQNIENRIWASAYALSAISEKDWNQIFKNFSKKSIQSDKESENKENPNQNESTEITDSENNFEQVTIFSENSLQENLPNNNLLNENSQNLLINNTKKINIDLDSEIGSENFSDNDNRLTNQEANLVESVKNIPQNNGFYWYLGLGVLFSLLVGIILKLRF